MRGGSLRLKKVSVGELLHPPALGDLREITAAVAEDGRPASWVAPVRFRPAPDAGDLRHFGRPPGNGN